jgi:hypothetical protein
MSHDVVLRPLFSGEYPRVFGTVQGHGQTI